MLAPKPTLVACVRSNPPEIEAAQPDAPFTLADIYDEEIEAAAQAAYGRDYATFGFSNWKG